MLTIFEIEEEGTAVGSIDLELVDDVIVGDELLGQVWADGVQEVLGRGQLSNAAAVPATTDCNRERKYLDMA